MIAQLDKDYLKIAPLRIPVRLLSYALFEGRPLTTRGRWINPLVFAHLRLWMKLPPIKQVEQPIFIAGMGRSGTTVLGKTLSVHEDVGFLNEPKAVWHSFCPNEDVNGNYCRDDASFRLDENDLKEDTIQNAHRLFGAYLYWSCRSRLVDKNPEVIFRTSFVKNIFPDAKILFNCAFGSFTRSSYFTMQRHLSSSAQSRSPSRMVMIHSVTAIST